MRRERGEDVYKRQEESSGVTINCDVPCHVLSGKNWQRDLAEMENSIVFIDEDNAFMKTYEFAHAARHSSNYYVCLLYTSLFQYLLQPLNICARYPYVFGVDMSVDFQGYWFYEPYLGGLLAIAPFLLVGLACIPSVDVYKRQGLLFVPMRQFR